MVQCMLIAVAAALVNNVVLSQFLGLCPFLGVSKKTDTAAGMGADPDRRHARRSAAVPRHPGGAQLLCAAQRGNCFCLRGSGAAQRAG